MYNDVRTFIAESSYTIGMNLRDSLLSLGLDYPNSPFIKGTTPVRSYAFLIEDSGLIYEDQEENVYIPLDFSIFSLTYTPSPIKNAKTQAQIAFIRQKIIQLDIKTNSLGQQNPLDPYRGTGGTAPLDKLFPVQIN